ncbi:hypothetical protein [Lacticaseibacillus sp. 866-1]|uniref:hypothetical protein n=1 Tax=Lacticaseibacillus sp. 866-1 TaxID=2799576 RepID=UPI00194283D8|nr:hypothetical protein [Lacticaseibacillus sp. 866-1]
MPERRIMDPYYQTKTKLNRVNEQRDKVLALKQHCDELRQCKYRTPDQQETLDLYEATLQAQEAKLRQITKQVSGWIDMLDFFGKDQEQETVRYYYQDCYSLSEVASLTYCTKRTAQRHLAAGVGKIDALLNYLEKQRKDETDESA